MEELTHGSLHVTPVGGKSSASGGTLKTIPKKKVKAPAQQDASSSAAAPTLVPMKVVEVGDLSDSGFKPVQEMNHSAR